MGMRRCTKGSPPIPSASCDGATPMIQGSKILITGVTGKAVLPIAAFLAERNEVWGLSRFATPEREAAVRALGIRPVAVDLATPDFAGVPQNFDYVLNFAWTRGSISELPRAWRVKVQRAGRFLPHCPGGRAALLGSSQGL